MTIEDITESEIDRAIELARREAEHEKFMEIVREVLESSRKLLDERVVWNEMRNR